MASSEPAMCTEQMRSMKMNAVNYVILPISKSEIFLPFSVYSVCLQNDIHFSMDRQMLEHEMFVTRRGSVDRHRNVMSTYGSIPECVTMFWQLKKTK